MTATPEQHEAYRQKQEAGETMVQQIHRQLIQDGLAHGTPYPPSHPESVREQQFHDQCPECGEQHGTFEMLHAVFAFCETHKLRWELRRRAHPEKPPAQSVWQAEHARMKPYSLVGDVMRPASVNQFAPVPDSPAVSIIVAARNYGHFLRECLASCLAQTVPNIEVIYSDDASTDDSLAVARSFPDVRTVQRAEHTGVCATRNRGVAVSRGEILIHVDGDDRLPPDFVAKHLAAMTPATPFAYGPAQAFGMHSTLWEVQPWGEKSIWDMNFCNTSSAIRRTVFDAAGGWCENPSGTMWDWDLFLRASRFGVPAVSTATLQYRQHQESWSHTHESESDWNERIKLLAEVRRARARLSIGCIYSGRLPGLLSTLINAICANVARAGLSEPPDLTMLDNSKDQADAIHRETGKRGELFSAVRILRHPWQCEFRGEVDRRNQVASYMAASSNRLLSETRGELIWLIEDDVVPPPLALREMFTTITAGYPMPAAASALYRNRHVDRGWIAGRWRDDVPQGVPVDLSEPLPTTATKVPFAGTGCLIFWRSLAPRSFVPFIRCKSGDVPAHDWAFTEAIRASGRDTVLLPSVRCRHYKTEREWV